jgi:hypothetical protein
MRQMRRHTCPMLSAAILPLVFGWATNAGAVSPTPMDAKQMAVIRYYIHESRQMPGHWGEMETKIPYNELPFELAFTSYALAVAQEEYVPAYRELYQDTQLRLIRLMLNKDVWGNWPKLATGKMYPEFKKYLPTVLPPGQQLQSPVGVDNIAYSGHLLEMVSLYEMLYQAHEFDQPGSISFSMSGPDGFHSSYDYTTLAQTIHRQEVDSGYVGVACEPGSVYMECNEHPILGLMQYDQLHGTHLSDVRWQFLKMAEKLGYINPRTNLVMDHYQVEVRQQEDHLVGTHFAVNDGWNGVMFHAWNRDLADQVYPSERDADVPLLLDTDPSVFSVVWGNQLTCTGFSLMAAFAAEEGDQATAKKMLAFADAHFHPKWVDGYFYYPEVNVVDVADPYIVSFDDDYNYHLAASKYGKYTIGPVVTVELGLARLDPGNGLWDVYNRLTPSGLTVLERSPTLVDVTYPEVLVTRAVYDTNLRQLTVQTVPGTDLHRATTVSVANLKAASEYVVSINGARAFRLREGKVAVLSARIGDASAAWDRGTQRLRITYMNNGTRNIDVVEAGAVTVKQQGQQRKGLVARAEE